MVDSAAALAGIRRGSPPHIHVRPARTLSFSSTVPYVTSKLIWDETKVIRVHSPLPDVPTLVPTPPHLQHAWDEVRCQIGEIVVDSSAPFVVVSLGHICPHIAYQKLAESLQEESSKSDLRHCGNTKFSQSRNNWSKLLGARPAQGLLEA
ncbi:hypothetical protein Bbelb_009600 [Branchiostoma belcheri]|nr:hypothetical protein Bbelb_009600 [Branchiostoma belcheri]